MTFGNGGLPDSAYSIKLCFIPCLRGWFFTEKLHGVNGIENFWNFAKRRLTKFNGCASDKFVLHLKACEFRYNHRDEGLFKIVSKIFKR